MKCKVIIVLITMALSMQLLAQEQVQQAVTDSSRLIIHQLESGMAEGKVRVIQDPLLTTILRKHYEFNRNSSIPGWRILIYKGREMTRANQAKADFEASFGQLNMRVNVEYGEPDFSTLVGSFRTKEDAYRYKQMLIARFPQAYLIPGRITLD